MTSEGLSHFVLLCEQQLRRAPAEYVEQYYAERHHQGLGGTLPEPGEAETPTDGAAVCHERLGGLLKLGAAH